MLLRLLLVFFFYFFFLALPNHGGTCTQSGPIPHAIRTNPLPYQKKVVILQYQNALWCNGSTPDSGSVCEGSSPSKATKSKSSLWWFALFLFVPARNRGTADILICVPIDVEFNTNEEELPVLSRYLL